MKKIQCESGPGYSHWVNVLLTEEERSIIGYLKKKHPSWSTADAIMCCVNVGLEQYIEEYYDALSHAAQPQEPTEASREGISLNAPVVSNT